MKKSQIKKIAPLFVIFCAVILFFAFDGHHFLTFEKMAQHDDALKAFIKENFLSSFLVFILLYAAVTAMSIPGATIGTLFGGYLFGIFVGSQAVIIGATLGACLIFLAAKTALSGLFKNKVSSSVGEFKKGFQENAFSYLLFLRLVPLFPFWLVNIIPAFLGVSFQTYLLATFLGIIPGTIVYVSVGNGLGIIIDQGKEPDMGIIFSPEIFLPILALAFLALIPIIYKKIKQQE